MPSLDREFGLRTQGYAHIAGIDEAGRGAWAGPVTAAAVILPLDQPERLRLLAGVNDSKQLSAKQREAMRKQIQQVAVAWAIGEASADEIDRLGIVPATRLAMQRASEALLPQPHALLIDAVRLPALALPQQSFNFADSISLSVAAASILAKTARDAALDQLDAEHPGYGFAKHKGYGTAAHCAALHRLGVSPLHRRSYAPIAQLITPRLVA
ncbi:MAG: ribonuclease HII [Anaerolineae bacterium]|nr:ribonuclease HII [Anaerolineae bacterium]